RHDDVAGLPRPVSRTDKKAPRAATQVLDGDFLADRGVERPGVPFEVADGLGGGHVAGRIVAVVPPPREASGPVRAEELERIPPLRAPAVGYAAALEDDVVDGSIVQTVADSQTGRPGSDDEGVDGRHGTGQPASTSMLTGTELEMMSKTAERWRDWSTSWR